MIQLSDLDFSYRGGEFRLRVPELAVGRGERVAFIGPSGSGKTTLLNLIAGILVPQRGRIQIGGSVMNELSDQARRNFRISSIGLVFQEFELLEYLTVLDNILLPYRINPTLRLDATVRKRAEELAERVGIAGKLRKFPRWLSQGERQRAAVCRSVLPGPSLLLADEPTGNLDPVNTDRVLEIIFNFLEESGATFVSVTHEYHLLERFGRTIDFRQAPGGVSEVEEVGRGDNSVPIPGRGASG